MEGERELPQVLSLPLHTHHGMCTLTHAEAHTQEISEWMNVAKIENGNVFKESKKYTQQLLEDFYLNALTLPVELWKLFEFHCFLGFLGFFHKISVS